MNRRPATALTTDSESDSLETEASLPEVGKNPVPRPPVPTPRVDPQALGSSMRVFFVPDPDLQPARPEIFGEIELGWYNRLVSSPYNLDVRAMGYLEDGSGYAIDLIGTDRTVQGITDVISASIGPDLRGLTVDPFESQ